MAGGAGTCSHSICSQKVEGKNKVGPDCEPQGPSQCLISSLNFLKPKVPELSQTEPVAGDEVLKQPVGDTSL